MLLILSYNYFVCYVLISTYSLGDTDPPVYTRCACSLTLVLSVLVVHILCVPANRKPVYQYHESSFCLTQVKLAEGF